MRAAIVSDAHVAAADLRQWTLVKWIDGLDVDRLVILGDLFHAWWGWPGHVPALVAPVCNALRRLRARGVALTFVPGNHDFFPGQFFTDELVADVTGEHERPLGGLTACLAHGDEADRSLGYRALRRVIRGPAAGRALGALGPRWGQPVLNGLAGTGEVRSAARSSLVSAQQRWSAHRLRRGADAVFLGHSHHAALVRLSDGLVVHTGAWAGLRTFVTVEDRTVQLWRFGSAASEQEILDQESL